MQSLQINNERIFATWNKNIYTALEETNLFAVFLTKIRSRVTVNKLKDSLQIPKIPGVDHRTRLQLNCPNLYFSRRTHPSIPIGRERNSLQTAGIQTVGRSPRYNDFSQARFTKIRYRAWSRRGSRDSCGGWITSGQEIRGTRGSHQSGGLKTRHTVRGRRTTAN